MPSDWTNRGDEWPFAFVAYRQQFAGVFGFLLLFFDPEKLFRDLGRDGAVGEADFTRIELTRQNPIQQKQFFVRFLRPGVHNLSFELRAEEILKGHEWHCRDGNLQVCINLALFKALFC